jgi:hypothetical protein
MLARVMSRLYNNFRRCQMAGVKEMTIDDLEEFIEHKLLEILGDPDAGLQLQPEFKKKLEIRLKKASRKISHQEVMKRFA